MRKVSDLVTNDDWHVNLRQLHKDSAAWIVKQVEGMLTAKVNVAARSKVADTLGSDYPVEGSALQKAAIDKWVAANQASYATMRKNERDTLHASFQDGSIGVTGPRNRDTSLPPRAAALMPLITRLLIASGRTPLSNTMSKAATIAYVALFESKYGDGPDAADSPTKGKYAAEIAAAVAAGVVEQDTTASLDDL
jgi:hypothetical protein